MSLPVVFEYFPVAAGVFIFVLGACFGSFAGVIISRFATGASIVLPKSHCDSCGRSLELWQKIPIISWCILGGKCFYCKARIGFRALFLEILLGITLLGLYFGYGLSIALVERFIFVFCLICISYIDIDSFYLPYSLLLVLASFAVLFTLVYCFVPGAYISPQGRIPILNLLTIKNITSISLFIDRLLGGCLGFFILALCNFGTTFVLRKSKRLNESQWAMGWGDPLLLMAIGLTIGASHIVLALFIASSLGTVFGILYRIKPKKHEHEDLDPLAIPFAPFLALGGIYSYLF